MSAGAVNPVARALARDPAPRQSEFPSQSPAAGDGLRLLYVNAHDVFGGAETLCRTLAEGCLRGGHQVEVAVAWQHADLPYVARIGAADEPTVAERVSERLAPLHRHARLQTARRWLNAARTPGPTVRSWLGYEEYDYPASRALLRSAPERYDLVHLHNLHSGYFDLRALAALSRRLPVVLTLHDGWLLTGHCAFPHGCERWASGCGQCPDLTTFPAIRRDATRANWKRKQRIYQRSSVHVAVPCAWLGERVARSMLQAAAVETRVIPNGVDLEVFRPRDRRAARAAFGLPQDARIVMIAGQRVLQNRSKDFATLQAALQLLAARDDRDLLCLAVGQSGDATTEGSLTVRPVPFQTDPRQLAALYSAADLYVHAALEDTFPTVVLEAMACGLPVVASRVGGIPEQVQHGRTGLLCEPRQPEALAAAIASLLDDDLRRHQLGAAGLARARTLYGRDTCIRAYEGWYREIVAERAQT